MSNWPFKNLPEPGPGNKIVPVAPARVLATIRGIIDKPLHKAGFKRVGPQCWVRRSKEPIREVMLVTMRSGRAGLSAGVVLPGIPKLLGRNLARSSKPELYDDLVSYRMTRVLKSDAPIEVWMFQATAKRVHDELRRVVPIWLQLRLAELERVHTVKNLRAELMKANRQIPLKNRYRHLDTNYITLAFVHALLGEKAKAEKALGDFIKATPRYKPHAKKLRKMLAETIPT